MSIELYEYPRQVEFSKIPNLSEKIAVIYLIQALKGHEIIAQFPESSSFLIPHDLDHFLMGNYFQFANCPVNFPQDEAVTVAFQLFHTKNFRQILSQSAKESSFVGSAREYFFKIIKFYLNPKQQNSMKIKQHLVRIFDLSYDLADFLDKLKDPIGKNIKEVDAISSNFLQDEMSFNLHSKDLIFEEKTTDFAFKYAENKFIMAIYNQIQNEINFLGRELEN